MITEEEKWALLGALYKHGTNLEALQEVLPEWSTARLEYTINRYRRRAAKVSDIRTPEGPLQMTKIMWITLDFKYCSMN